MTSVSWQAAQPVWKYAYISFSCLQAPKLHQYCTYTLTSLTTCIITEVAALLAVCSSPTTTRARIYLEAAPTSFDCPMCTPISIMIIAGITVSCKFLGKCQETHLSNGRNFVTNAYALTVCSAIIGPLLYDVGKHTRLLKLGRLRNWKSVNYIDYDWHEPEVSPMWTQDWKPVSSHTYITKPMESVLVLGAPSIRRSSFFWVNASGGSQKPNWCRYTCREVYIPWKWSVRLCQQINYLEYIIVHLIFPQQRQYLAKTTYFE